MDQVTTTKVHFHREQWRQIILECQASGLSIRTWCNQHGFKEQSYYYYLRKIREEELKNLPTILSNIETKPVEFKKLEVQSLIPNTKAVVIIRLSNATVEITEEYVRECSL